MYQQFLNTLAEEGVLVAVASKNEPRTVDEVFSREDVILSRERVFPLVVNWASKAQSVSRVLELWNVTADAVVFVDDNPTELAEVKEAHPGIECLRFPHDADAIYQLLVQLRDLFGRNAVSNEDMIRRASLRARAIAVEADGDAEGFSESLLEHAEAELTLDFEKDPADSRALALLNKTNQFNLNGKRMTERAWADFLADRRTFLLTVGYKDRFGPLGKIAVAGGRIADDAVQIDFWVMSCRAFARRIEHQCLRALFERFAGRPIAFDFVETQRNAPLARFLNDISGSTPVPGLRVTAESFEATCPRLFHRVAIREETGI